MHGLVSKSSTPKTTSIPLFACPVIAGFPSPADDHIEAYLDLNRLLNRNSTATFFMRFEGDAMLESGIYHGDLLIVDRAISPVEGKIVVAAINSELVVRKIQIIKKQIYLLSENPNCETICIDHDTEFQIWGVITYVIHAMERRSRGQ